jgi:Protein of unknown function (DUF3568)
MKKGFFAIIAVVALGVVGCVSTVDDQTTAGLKMSTDKVENRYERPMSVVYPAAVRAFKDYGQVSRESTLLGTTNKVQAIEGKANDVDVWVRVEAVTPQITAVTVQARTTWGGSQVAIANQLATRIALQLAK